MNSILDGFLVGVALLASAGYAVLALGPRGLRGRLLASLSRVTARAPAFLGLRRTAQRLATAATGKSPGACGGCDDCGSEKAPAAQAPAAEVRVPMRKIGRRA
jgi:hypothetical protein